MADNLLTVADGLVVSMEYTLRLDDGEVLDTSTGGEPLEFIQGQGQIIPGLERALYGMGIGDEMKVAVTPEDGYGEHDPEAYEEVPTNAFPTDIELESGMELQVSDQAGEVYQAYVAEIRPDTVLLDFNHPLAGETLNFEVKIAGLRAATAEETEHGHVHGH
ncbi:MAG: peptidylprolyl isomerase [Chloroflexi bacterium]|nr:peptidylprolyl isomerase [Chloroflexota bacterium]